MYQLNEEERTSVKESLEKIEEGLQELLEIDTAGSELDEILEKGFTVNTGIGMPAFLIKLSPKSIRDTLRI